MFTWGKGFVRSGGDQLRDRGGGLLQTSESAKLKGTAPAMQRRGVFAAEKNKISPPPTGG